MGFFVFLNRMLHYVYALTVSNVVRYVGKGSGDRILTYFSASMSGATPYLKKKLTEARQCNQEIGFLILDQSDNEAWIYEKEAVWIKRHGIDNLWNKTTGGKAGWKVTPTTRTMQSLGQRNRYRGNHASRAGLGHLLSDIEKAPELRDRVLTWTVTPAEGNALNLPAGLVELNCLQVQALKDYRYQHAKSATQIYDLK